MHEKIVHDTNQSVGFVRAIVEIICLTVINYYYTAIAKVKILWKINTYTKVRDKVEIPPLGISIQFIMTCKSYVSHSLLRLK